MKIVQIVTFIFFIIILVPSVFSQQACLGTEASPCTDWKKFDYENGDISKVPIKELNLELVFKHKRGKELTPAQIKYHINSIENVMQVNINHAREVLSGFGITLQDARSDTLSFRDGVLATGQNRVKIVKEFHEKGTFVVGKDGTITFKLQQVKKEIKDEDDEDIVILPEFPETDSFRLDLSEVGNADFFGYTVTGVLSLEKGEPIVKKGDKATFDSILIDAYLSKVSLCNDLSSCSGDYVFVGNDQMSAKGKGFSLGFSEDNAYFRIFKKSEFPAFNQNDLLEIFVGDDKKAGEFTLKTTQFQEPEMKTSGWLRILNNDNQITIDSKEVYKELPEDTTPEWLSTLQGDSSQAERGSVSFALIPDGNSDDVYIFDENQAVHVLPEEKYNLIKKDRTDIGKKYDMELIGYFSDIELSIFSHGLEAMQKKFGIDFRKLSSDLEGEQIPFSVMEHDKRIPIRGHEESKNIEAAVNGLIPSTIFWSPRSDLDDISVVETKKWRNLETKLGAYASTFTHETGHTIDFLGLSASFLEKAQNPELMAITPFQEKLKSKLSSFGFTFSPFKREGIFTGYHLKGSEYMFPTDYSKTELSEYTAVLFETITFLEQEWRDGIDLPTNIPQNEREKILKQRGELADLVHEEAKKYRSTASNKK